MTTEKHSTWEKLNPWNWFKHENDEDKQQHVPVTRRDISVANTAAQADPLLRLHREMDRLFDDVFSSVGLPSLRSPFFNNGWQNELAEQNPQLRYRPQIDVTGDDKQYEINLDVPGLSQQDLSVEVSGDVLVVKGHKEEKNESDNKQFYRVERSYGAFQRTLSLPQDAISEDIQASLKDGVLNLRIPRRDTPASQVKHIPIS